MTKEQIISRRDSEAFLDWIERLIEYVEASKENGFGIYWDDVYESLIGVRVSQTESRKRCYLLRDIAPILRLEAVSGTMIEEIMKITEEIENEENVHDGKATEADGQEEIRTAEYVDYGDYFVVSSSKRSFEIDKIKVKRIKDSYCGEPWTNLTVNETCRTHDISRPDLILVFRAFNITHDDTPFLDEEFDLRSVEALVNESLEKKKELYFTKLQQEEIRKSLKELKKYREKDFLYTKAMNSINNAIVIPEKFDVIREYEHEDCEGLLDLADMHLGMRTTNYWNKYDFEETVERFDRLLDMTIKKGVMHGIKTLHVSLLGDNISGVIHDSLRAENEFDINEQVEKLTELIAQGLIRLATVFKKVVVSDTYGNHGRIFPNKTANGDKDSFESFFSWGLRLRLRNSKENLVFESNLVDEGIIVKKIMGRTIFEVHGHEDKFAKVAEDLTMMIEKPDEVHMGHMHQNKSREVHGVEVFICRSFCGVDNFAKSIRATGKAGQKMYIYNGDGTRAIYDFVLN